MTTLHKRSSAQIHDYPSAFPYLTLTHVHSDECCGLDDFGNPSFVCDYEFNACTTCVSMDASPTAMAECVRVRREKARKQGRDERKRSTIGVF